MTFRRDGALFVLVLLLSPASLAADPPAPADPAGHPAAREARFIARLDLALYGRGGAKGGGGTRIERGGSSASFDSAAGIAVATEVRVAGPVWIEAGASSFATRLEVVRDHGLDQPIEVHEGRASTASWSVGLDLRPAAWRYRDVVQVAVFARCVLSRFGEPPAAANVTMERRARGINAGVRADVALRRTPWMIGMDLSFGDARPRLGDPSAGTKRKVETADVYVALGVRRAF